MISVKDFYDQSTGTFSYILIDNVTKESAIIDSVLGYDIESKSINTIGVDAIIEFVKQNQLNLKYIFETHVHADHLTGAYKIKEFFPTAQIAIHENIKYVYDNFKNQLGLSEPLLGFDIYLKEGCSLRLGDFRIEVIHTPGHTPACCCFLIDNKLFTGDTLFMPDFGTGRCDFPGGSASDLYDSVMNKIYKLDDFVEVYVGHDYMPSGRELRNITTIKESRFHNKHIGAGTSKFDFVKFREKRDKELNLPKLLYPSLKANLYTGKIVVESEGI